jgi:hypothetical protein
LARLGVQPILIDFNPKENAAMSTPETSPRAPAADNSGRPIKWILAVIGGLAACGALAACAIAVLPLIISAGVLGRVLPDAIPMIATGVKMGGLADQDFYKESVRLAASDRQVQAALGAPVTDVAATASGTVSTRGVSGTADIIVTLKGSKGEGQLQASARRENGTWVYYTLVVEVNGELIKVEH